MRDKILVVVGCNRGKLETMPKREYKYILDFINSHVNVYSSIISIVRKATEGNDNFRRRGIQIYDSSLDCFDYPSDNIICVPGFDINVDGFRKDVHYDVICISTAASVLCVAMSFFSAGYELSVLRDYCVDRKGLNKEAFKIMNTYMPGIVV